MQVTQKKSMIRYRTYQNNNQKSDFYGKWYARAIVTETVVTCSGRPSCFSKKPMSSITCY